MIFVQKIVAWHISNSDRSVNSHIENTIVVLHDNLSFLFQPIIYGTQFRLAHDNSC